MTTHKFEKEAEAEYYNAEEEQEPDHCTCTMCRELREYGVDTTPGPPGGNSIDDDA